MKELLLKKATLIYISVLFLTIFLRFYNLSGGLVLGEPDEVTHQEIVDNFRQSFWPRSSGGPWYYELPLYPFLGYLFSFVFKEKYLSLRIVSSLTTGILVLGIYYYLRHRTSNTAAFIGALLFSLSPLALFYSRVGMLDASVVSFSFLSLIFFELSYSKKSPGSAILAGLFLGLGTFIKYSALVFFIVPAFCLLIFSLRRSRRYCREVGLGVILDLNSLLTLVVASIVILPVAAVLYAHDRYLFKMHLMTNLGLLKDVWWQQAKEFGIKDYRGDITWWLTFPVVLLFFLGLPLMIRRAKSWWIFGLYFLLIFWVVVTRTPFYPRYFLLMVPFICVVAALGVEAVWHFMLIRSRKFLALTALSVFLLGIAPTAWEALASSRHRLLEETGAFIKTAPRTGDGWLFSTYWPNFFSEILPTLSVAWLADSSWETSAFADSQSRSSLDILRENGGLVAVEYLYSSDRRFKNPISRLSAREFILGKVKPSRTIFDKSPNFPHYKSSLNRMDLFLVSKGSL